MDDPDIWFGLPPGASKGIDGHLVYEMVDMGYQMSSMCAANMGVDLDQDIDGIDMMDFDRMSESMKESAVGAIEDTVGGH